MTRHITRAALVLAAVIAARELQLHVKDKRAEARGEPTWPGVMREARQARKAGLL